MLIHMEYGNTYIDACIQTYKRTCANCHGYTHTYVPTCMHTDARIHTVHAITIDTCLHMHKHALERIQKTPKLSALQRTISWLRIMEAQQAATHGIPKLGLVLGTTVGAVLSCDTGALQNQIEKWCLSQCLSPIESKR